MDQELDAASTVLRKHWRSICLHVPLNVLGTKDTQWIIYGLCPYGTLYFSWENINEEIDKSAVKMTKYLTMRKR
jgi:hypothetical protein